MTIGAAISLDAQQERAIGFAGRRLKLLGGPSTGKTTTLVQRALHLVQSGVDPGGVLFFVQDRRQSIELRDRLVRELGRSVAGPSLMTFHAFCWSLLNRSFPVQTSEGPSVDVGYQLAGLPAEPVLLTAFDQRALVRQLLEQEQPSDWPINGDLLRSAAFAGEVRDFLLHAQQRLEFPDDVERAAKEKGREDWVELAGFYRRYLNHLGDADAFDDRRPRVDFASVLTEARRALAEHPAVAADFCSIYPHILVDDFEEANRAEASLINVLISQDGSDERSVVVAGDPDGSVFAFRGADPQCLVEFPADEELTLTTAYRTSAEPTINLYSHVTEEARGVVAEIRRAVADGTAYGDTAVIVRDYRTLVGPLRRELGRAGVPFRVEGEALQLTADPVVRPVLNLFTIACNRPGYEELWPSFLTSELGGLSAYELIEIRRSARMSGFPIHEACSSLLVGLSPGTQEKLSTACALVEQTCTWAENLPPDDCFWRLWRSSEWFAELVEQEADRKLDSLTTLADALARFTERLGSEARIHDFMDTLASAEFAPESVRLDRTQDAVAVTTAHGCKGREFDFAVVAGCVEGMWPDPSRRGLLLETDLLAHSKSQAERQKLALEEEERLFRLARSRARRLVLTGQRSGGSERSSSEPSRFLSHVGVPIPERNSAVPDLVLTQREAEIAWRKVLSKTDNPPHDRLAALWGLVNLTQLDPDRWWWDRTWTQNTAPVHATKKTSYSRFSSYENCPLQYLLGQVLGLDPESTYQMAFGSLVHGLLEDVEKGELPTDVDALVAEAKRRWRPESFPPGAVTAFLQRELVQILDRYIAFEAENGHQMLETEKGFNFEIEGWRVRGKIDRIDRLDRNGLRLLDYKTSNSWKNDREGQEDLQLATYLLACKRDDELKELGEPKVAELVFVRHAQGRKFRRATQLTKNAEDETPWDMVTAERIAGVLRGINEDKFAPSPDADCMFCSFREICPMWPEGRELDVAEDEIGAVR